MDEFIQHRNGCELCATAWNENRPSTGRLCVQGRAAWTKGAEVIKAADPNLYAVLHWFEGNDKPVPEAFEHEFAIGNGTIHMKTWAVLVPDLVAFSKLHGDIMLKGPRLQFPYWAIVVTEHNAWPQY